MVTQNNKEQFGTWFCSDYCRIPKDDESYSKRHITLGHFLNRMFSEQLGVFLKYYREVHKLHLIVNPYGDLVHWSLSNIVYFDRDSKNLQHVIKTKSWMFASMHPTATIEELMENKKIFNSYEEAAKFGLKEMDELINKT